ncbi:hypothetical protein L6164_013003 [Bauhinia variegata]|uniref:Uncharacterized protein n=1 Tax=Bauhinia variegata TaxID=167791 RepID=A0ACB9PBZ9_BAUVA|nr:hypothetical protein L6164_013003 [Bauhinia variegata]
MILEDAAMKKFQVTYDYLPESCLRFCLIFLSIFPENAVIRKRPLIYWWIGEGLISDEEKGEKIFEELLKHEFIIPHGNGKNPLVKKCTIHPWVRYFLISLAINAELLRLDSKGVPRFDIISSRRACLLSHDEGLSQLKERNSDDNVRDVSGKDYKDLRSIFNVNERYISFGLKQLANLEKRKLKVLQLGRWQDLPTHHIEVVTEAFLKGLWIQKHLKYLSLRGISRITAIPDSVVELTNLEILDLKACHNLEKLPKDISALEKLTHLDVSECYLLESMPLGIDKLTSLEVLKGFVIGNSNKTPCRIRDLRKLQKLKRLSIQIGSEAIAQEGEFQMLKELKSVLRLKISWCVVSEEHRYTVEKESFSFHRLWINWTLKVFLVRYYQNGLCQVL